MHCEYPVDADDEYVTEKGFLPTLPGEYTKLSSALALFRLSRILSKVLSELYPGSTSHDISFRTIATLADELEDWQTNLAPHLKLTFAQDKPSTNVTSSRSPILVSTIHTVIFVQVLTTAVSCLSPHQNTVVPSSSHCQPWRQGLLGCGSCRRCLQTHCTNR